MSRVSRSIALVSIVPAMLLLSASGGCSNRTEEARAQVLRWAERLDAQTTQAGVYVRHEGEVLPESDPWGKAIQVGYSRGGMTETLTVRSFGPDGIAFTDDDIIERRSKASLAGIGTGIKENVGDVAENAGKGLFKGAVQGLKEGVRSARERSDPERDDDAAADAEPSPTLRES